MKTSEGKSALWESLSFELEAGPNNSVQLPELDQFEPSPVSDRLATLFLSGFLPVLLLLVAATSHSGPLLGAIGFILGLPVAWLLSPLGSRPWRLALLAVPVLAFANLAFVVPVAAFGYIERRFFINQTPFLTDLFARSAQTMLEAAFSWSAFAVYLMVAGVAVALRVALRHRYPWVDPRSPGSYRLPAGLAALSLPFLVYGGAILAALPTPSSEQWLSESRQQVGTTVPEKSGKGRWAARYDKWWTEHGKAWQKDKTPPKEAFLALEKELLEHYTQEPLETEEMNHASRLFDVILRDYLRNLPEGVPSAPSETVYLSLWTKLGARPRYERRYCERMLVNNIAPILCSPELDEASLILWKERVESLNKLLLDSALESRAIALKHLEDEKFLDGRRLPNGRTVYNWPQGRPSSMSILGRETKISPTLLFQRFKRNQTIDECLSIWHKAESLGPRERDAYLLAIRGKADNKIQPFARNSEFIHQLHGRAYAAYIRPWLETFALILQLRQHQLDTGSYPTTLESLGVSGEHWLWEPSNSGGVLTDTRLLSQEKGNPVLRWVLP